MPSPWPGRPVLFHPRDASLLAMAAPAVVLLTLLTASSVQAQDTSAILSGILGSLTSTKKAQGCPGECVHAITALLCDYVVDEIQCGATYLRCCVPRDSNLGTAVETSAPLPEDTAVTPNVTLAPTTTEAPSSTTEDAPSERNACPGVCVDGTLSQYCHRVLSLPSCGPGTVCCASVDATDPPPNESERRPPSQESPAEGLPECPGSCVSPLFSLLCDQVSTVHSCSGGGSCCISAESATTTEAPPPPCDGRCFPPFLSGVCRKPAELILKSSCPAGTICCSGPLVIEEPPAQRPFFSAHHPPQGARPPHPPRRPGPQGLGGNPGDRPFLDHRPQHPDQMNAVIPLGKPPHFGYEGPGEGSSFQHGPPPRQDVGFEPPRQERPRPDDFPGPHGPPPRQDVEFQPPRQDNPRPNDFPGHHGPPPRQDVEFQPPRQERPRPDDFPGHHGPRPGFEKPRPDFSQRPNGPDHRPEQHGASGPRPPQGQRRPPRPPRPGRPEDHPLGDFQGNNRPPTPSFGSNSLIAPSPNATRDTGPRAPGPVPPVHGRPPTRPVGPQQDLDAQLVGQAVVFCPGECVPDFLRFTCFGENALYPGLRCQEEGRLCCARTALVEQIPFHVEPALQPNSPPPRVVPVTTTPVPPTRGTSRRPSVCGVKGSFQRDSPRIVGGRDALPGEWCWQVALVNTKNQYLCGGALIGAQWVLTAAHCVTSLVRNGEKFFVRVGDHDLGSPVGSPGAQTQVVSTTYIHHNHNGQTLDNDIALLKVQVPFAMNDAVCVVCLPARGSSKTPGNRCTVTGYGYVSESGPISLKVREAQLPIVDDKQCTEQINAVTEKLFILPASTFCAGGLRGNDACQGDGGGPMVCQVDGFYELTGLVSWGFGCGRADVPGVYVKVSAFIGWINQIISVNNL